MNDRIQELAFKATELVQEVLNAQTSESMTTLTYHELYDQIFAELIIGECEKVVDSNFDCHEPWMRPGTLSEHFGIKYEKSN